MTEVSTANLTRRNLHLSCSLRSLLNVSVVIDAVPVILSSTLSKMFSLNYSPPPLL